MTTEERLAQAERLLAYADRLLGFFMTALASARTTEERVRDFAVADADAVRADEREKLAAFFDRYADVNPMSVWNPREIASRLRVGWQ